MEKICLYFLQSCKTQRIRGCINAMFNVRDQFKSPTLYSNTCSKHSNLTPSQCQIEVDPLSVICSKHFNQKNVNEDSFTQCPGEGGQEEVVE